MFETNGNFGTTRIADAVCTEEDTDSLYCIDRIFWHECNEQYGLSRSNGADNYLILLSMSGHGLLELEANNYVLQGGDIAIIPRGTPHRYRCAPGSIWTFYGIHIFPNHVSCLINRIVKENGVCFTHDDPNMQADLLEHMILNIKDNSPSCNFENSLLLSEFLHGLFHAKEPCVPDRRAANVLERAIAYIERNYANPIDIEALCSGLFLSPSHFTRLFKRQLGVTPYQYLEHYRILQARILLCQTRMPVSDIAATVGYKSVSNFILYFKKHIGTTPAAYRKSPGRYDSMQKSFAKQMTYSPLLDAQIEQ